VPLRPVLVCLYLAVLTAQAGLAQTRSSDYGAWYLEQYGPARPQDDADRVLLEESRSVFARTAAAADKKLGRLPRLLAVERPGIMSEALPDGTVVISLPLLRFCFDGVALDQGRARLAFVLGHELAHLAHHDSWRAEAFRELATAEPRLAQEARRWLADSLAESPSQLHAKELHADESGFIFMTMAGFDPRLVLGEREDFLLRWLKIQHGAPSKTASHPSFEQRSKALRSNLARVVGGVPFFRFGARLAQLGRYDDALRLLQQALATFPGREVENNLGLAYGQRGLARLAECGNGDGLRFKLPLAIDPHTLAARIHVRGQWSSCPQAAAAEEDFAASDRVLTSAIQRDPTYAPARLNLAALLALRREAVKALAVLPDAGRPEEAVLASDPRVEVLRAVILYDVGRILGNDTADGSLDALERVCGTPGTSDPALCAMVAFDRARILQERGRGEAALRAWKDFLGREPNGPFAVAAATALQPPEGDAADAAPRPTTSPAPAPRPLLDRVSDDAARRLRTAVRKPFTLGDVRGAFLAGDGVDALELRGVVEIVEESLPPGTLRSALGERHGAATWSVALWPHAEVVGFEGVAYDIDAGVALRRFFFQPR
jgi:tetratricopeptide (TPR) repeat protein